VLLDSWLLILVVVMLVGEFAELARTPPRSVSGWRANCSFASTKPGSGAQVFNQLIRYLFKKAEGTLCSGASLP